MVRDLNETSVGDEAGGPLKTWGLEIEGQVLVTLEEVLVLLQGSFVHLTLFPDVIFQALRQKVANR
jgi:hypothetical protein